ncbi:AAA domain-containing protein [Burkholderia cepacia]|uniref:AAA domain-containing protein n=1 Tax=Burkholderia cepacia TaxID=292 RepID=UPI001F32A554|nr:AAA domain-containing protein [Burkholderia cepacia]MCE4124523.1 AAA domain-containing protein [Burkholderia cepacia]
MEKDTGLPVILKYWKRTPEIKDDEVREIWRQEIRQLHRLAGYPGAREYIVSLLDSSEEPDGFYLALSPGQRVPVGALLKTASDHHYLRQVRPERARILLWQNLRRVSAGLEILHTQGLLHRNLDLWAIFSDGGDEPDFQLSGFEWSIRITGRVAQSNRSKKVAQPTPLVHSFREDWRALGQLAATLFGLPSGAFGPARTRDSGRDPASFLSGPEKDLIQRLLIGDEMDRVDGEFVAQKISSILSILETIVGKRESKLILTCALGPTSPLTKAIREASKRSIEADEIEKQLAFVAEDLVDEPLLLTVKQYPEAPESLVLAGNQITYRLQPFQPWQAKKTGADPSWAIAYCSAISAERPAPISIVQQQSLSDRGIQVVSLDEATRRYPMLLGKTVQWDRVSNNTATEFLDSGARRQHRALLLLQILEALLTASDIWPVTVARIEESDGRFSLRLKARPDPERARLSKALSLASPESRMYAAFSADMDSVDEDWVLTEAGVLGDQERRNAVWRFTDLEETPGEEALYVFDGVGPVPVSEQLFLRVADHAGDDRLLRRRIRALGALRDHLELLEMLDDPRQSIRRTHEKPEINSAYQALDSSKQQALSAIWAIVPLFLLQGPPGVGKTRLVRELVGRRIREDASTRMLLTAQSHHAVDHLLAEVQKELVDVDPQPIVVRSRSKDQTRATDDLDVRSQARRLVERFSASKIASSAPNSLKAKLASLNQSFSQLDDDDFSNRKTPQSRSVEALLLRSANFVFASANAGDLERLIDEKSQFDWSVVEEAGKATGQELLAPLLLSHRRLMIGDHKQLPPFNADKLKALLVNPASIRDALDVGASLVGRPFREAGADEIVDDSSDDLTEACGDAVASLMLFESMVEGEMGRAAASSSASRLPIAQRLTHQHRMQPAIAKLVSASFYEDELLTDESAVVRFATEEAPIYSADTRKLPDSPIVVVNMPFVQSTLNAKEIERTPRFHNPDEVAAALQALSLLRPRGVKTRPTLAVLSPYREQVKRLKNHIATERGNRLAHLDGFRFEGGADSPTGTVDSFQGSEADVVVVSLVRNNHHGGVRGLGFLADPRRMNVLLSRAKWKLVLIGSVEFLESRLGQPLPPGQSLDFLRRMLETVEQLRSEKLPGGVPLASVVTYADLMGGLQ